MQNVSFLFDVSQYYNGWEGVTNKILILKLEWTIRALLPDGNIYIASYLTLSKRYLELSQWLQRTGYL